MAGAPLGTRTAAKQSESKSKLMPNLFESRGLRRLWASHGQTSPYRGRGVVSKLKCPVFVAHEMSGFGLGGRDWCGGGAVGKWKSRSDFQGRHASGFSTAG